MADFLTYLNIQTEVAEIIKQFTGKKADTIKYVVNMVYLSEVMSAVGIYPPFWLVKSDTAHRSVTTATISGISKDNPGVITTAAVHGLSVGDVVSFYGVVGMTEINELQGTVTTTPSTTTFTTEIDTNSYTAYTSGGSVYHRGVTLANATDRILRAGWNEVTPPMKFVGYNDVQKDTIHHDLDYTGTPKFCRHVQSFTAAGVRADKLIWSGGPDVSRLLRVWYLQYIPRLSADADVPLLPPRFHDILVAGAVTRLIESKNEKVSTEDASVWPAIYASQLEALRLYNEKWWANVENSQQVEHFLA